MNLFVIQLSENIYRSTQFLEKRNVFESMKPFYYLAKFYGFAPFAVNNTAVKGIDYFLVIFNFICYLFIIYVQVFVDSFYKHDVRCVDISIKVLYFASSCVSLATLIRVFLNRNEIRNIFEQLNDIDEGVSVIRKHFHEQIF